MTTSRELLVNGMVNGVAIGNWQLAIGERQTPNGERLNGVLDLAVAVAVAFAVRQLPIASCPLPRRYAVTPLSRRGNKSTMDLAAILFGLDTLATAAELQ